MILSIAMMVKNEEKYLKQCLESLKPIMDVIDSELIIVDTGSTDNTVEIAKQFTDKVYFYEWKNNFSEVRNVTINYSTGQWVLIIDGDEVINNSQGIIQFFRSFEYKKFNTACVSVKNFMSMDIEEDFSVLLSPRLFRKDNDFGFKGAVHNQPKFKEPVLILNSEILHYGYINTDKELMERKFQRTATILKNELKNNPENIYYLYQLSVSYFMHKDFEEALEPIVRAYNLIKEKVLDVDRYLYVYSHLAKTYLSNGMFTEVEQSCLEIIKKNSIYIDLYFYLAKVQFLLNKNEEAIDNYKIYLEKVVERKNSNISSNIAINFDTLGKYEEAYLDLSILYDRVGKSEIALDFAKKIKSNNLLVRNFGNIFSLFIEMNRFDELKNYYNNKILINHTELEFDFLNCLEQYLLKVNKKIREKVYGIFSKGDSEYSLLNRLRIDSENDWEKLIEKVNSFDLNSLPDYYGDLLYYFMNKKISLNKILSKVCDFKLKAYLNFLLGKYDDLGTVIYEYLNVFPNIQLTVNDTRIYKILSMNLFKLDSINDVQYEEVFYKYLEYGHYYLNEVYNSNIIQDELVYSMKDEEDLFLMYIYLAKKNKDDKAQYVRYLRLALSTCNYMKKGIEILVDDVKKEVDQNNEEFDDYKRKVKDTILQLINNSDLIEAKNLISQYEEMVSDDIEICSIKSVIAIIENRLTDAEMLLKSGLKMDKDNFDLLYNLGYVYEVSSRYIESIRLYNMAKEKCNDSNQVQEIEDIILKIIGHNEKIIENSSGVKICDIVIYTNNMQDQNIEKLESIFNVLGFIDNRHIKRNDVYKIDKRNLNSLNFDYIIVLEKNKGNIKSIKNELNQYIDEGKIYDYYQCNYPICIEGFEYKFDEILKMPSVELLVTGLSYAETAIDCDLMSIPSFNFALSSQDLFYDYNIVKYLLNFQHIKDNLKYCIIGLSYYSFEFDLSKSNEATRVHRYLSTLGTTHNYFNIPQLNVIHYDYCQTDTKNDYLKISEVKGNTVMNSENKDVQQYIAKHHSQMNHPETVIENKKIFKDYLELLKLHNIKPIVVICPTNRNHYKYFECGTIKNKFYRIVDKFKMEYEFQILDYFVSDLFGDNDFWDYSHLNKTGANKFTKILKDKIIW